MAYQVEINGEVRDLDVPGEMPLLWALRNELGMVGTKFGCGMALCGACTVHIDGVAARSCTTPVSALAGKKVTTIEALAESPIGRALQQEHGAFEIHVVPGMRFDRHGAHQPLPLNEDRGDPPVGLVDAEHDLGLLEPEATERAIRWQPDAQRSPGFLRDPPIVDLRDRVRLAQLRHGGWAS